MGYNKTRRTMDRHVSSILSTGHALSLVKKDCSHASLNLEQMSKVNTWVLGQNQKNTPIGYSDVQKFIKDTFGISVHKRTAGNVLRRLGHTRKTCMTKTAGFTKPNSQLKQWYMKFIAKMKKERRFYRPLSVIHSIDVNYSKKPKTGVTTFSPK